jgi:hypothetical protein
MSDIWYSPETFYGYISKIDPCDSEIRKVENAGFFNLVTMIPEIPSQIDSERDLDDTAVAILGFEVSGDFEIMASMKADLIQFMESSDLKQYFKPKACIFSGFYWDVEQEEEEEDEEEDDEEETESEHDEEETESEHDEEETESEEDP